MNCPICQTKMIKIGFYTNKRGKFQRYKCEKCGITRTDFSRNLREVK